ACLAGALPRHARIWTTSCGAHEESAGACWSIRRSSSLRAVSPGVVFGCEGGRCRTPGGQENRYGRFHRSVYGRRRIRDENSRREYHFFCTRIPRRIPPEALDDRDPLFGTVGKSSGRTGDLRVREAL